MSGEEGDKPDALSYRYLERRIDILKQNSNRSAEESGADLEDKPKKYHVGSMTEPNERLAKLEGSYDALKVVRPLTITVLGVLMAALVFVLSYLASQLADVRSVVQNLRNDIQIEFRSQRSEMAEQLSAISNAITATKQQAPQVILVPAPQPAGAPQNTSPQLAPPPTRR